MRISILFSIIPICLGAWGQRVEVDNYVCDDGWTYTGQMANGKRHGQGSAITKKGNIYAGEWREHKLPWGTLTAIDGQNRSEYTGALNDSFAPHGFGIMRYVEGKNAGETYIGNFSNGMKTGVGKHIDKHGKITFGIWKNGALQTPEGHNFKIGDKVYGIDLSHHNTKVDWDNLAIYSDRHGRVHNGNAKDIKSRKYLQPVTFAYVRATEGASVKDSLYQKHTQNARLHDIPTGSYHMMCFTTSSAQDQIDNFLKATDNCSLDLMAPMLDLENRPQAAQAGKKQVQAMAEKWLKAVEKATGMKPVIYTNDKFAADFLDLSRLKGYTLWIARYNSEEPNTHPWYLWQFTERGNIKGIDKVDINFYDGNLKSFNRRMLRR